MVELLRHRQTKGAATDMFYLTPPRHISTLPWPCKNVLPGEVGEKPGPARSQATIAAISGLLPTMFMTRVRL